MSTQIAEATAKAEQKKALGVRRAGLIAELWPHLACSYFELATWAQEYVDHAIASQDGGQVIPGS